MGTLWGSGESLWGPCRVLGVPMGSLWGSGRSLWGPHRVLWCPCGVLRRFFGVMGSSYSVSIGFWGVSMGSSSSSGGSL